jgi:hypothetical protein
MYSPNFSPLDRLIICQFLKPRILIRIGLKGPDPEPQHWKKFTLYAPILFKIRFNWYKKFVLLSRFQKGILTLGTKCT